MAARCASCSYPLSVSDSVKCCECLSYFHIDCAQLVGFPYYELNSDPVRNTFHCHTCKILPLPHHSDDFSDSDEECAMPSRQLDYHLEGQQDFAKDMNEVKGTVQDLSELCKDMFREISELKSINLTLRCCIENLRHDGEKRDGLITELTRRVEALEGKRIDLFKPIDADVISIEKEEDPDRYSTPDPEYARLKEITSVYHGSTQKCSPSIQVETSNQSNIENDTDELEVVGETTTLENTESSETSTKETSYFGDETESEHNEENVHFAGEDTISKTTREDNIESGSKTLDKDWDWRGNRAVQLKENKNDSMSEEEEEDEITDPEDTEAQGWEILNEDEKSKRTENDEDENSETSTNIDESEENVKGKRVVWADEVENYNEDKNAESSEATEEYITSSDAKLLRANIEPSYDFKSSFEEEETEEAKEEVTDGAETTSLKEGEGETEETPKVEEELVVEIVEGVEVEDYIKAVYTGRVAAGEVPRLEGETRLGGDSTVEGGAVPEGGAEGGHSPEDQGEVQPSELSEGSEPPPPPQPQHTPDDLWDYLKETVTGEHPATVEEFVQKLIGTLEHVPEEYLKPVIDYNIRRAASPSVTDGEHLDTKEGEDHPSEETLPKGDSEGASGDDHVSPQGEASESGEHGFSSGEPHEDTSAPEGTSDPAEGYALEVAS